MASTTNGRGSVQTGFDKLGDCANTNLRNFNKENCKALCSGQNIPMKQYNAEKELTEELRF